MKQLFVLGRKTGRDTLQKPKLAAPSATTRNPRSERPSQRVLRQAWKRPEDKILRGWRGRPPGFLRGQAGAAWGAPRYRGGKREAREEGGRGWRARGPGRPIPPSPGGCHRSPRLGSASGRLACMTD